jgi:hypothetical protein
MFVVFNTRSLVGVHQFSERAYANCTELKVGCKLAHRCEIHFLNYLRQKKNGDSFYVLL